MTKKGHSNTRISLLITLLMVLNLGYVFFTGWSSDDLMYQSDRTKAIIEKIDFVTYYTTNQKQIAKSIGRIAPLNTSQIIPYFVDELLPYKLLLVVFTLVDIYLLYLLIKEISGNHYVSVLSTLVIMPMFQFRLYHEGLVSLYGIVQLMVFFVLFVFISLLKFHRTKKKIHFMFSIFSFASLILIYEVGVLFIIPIFLTVFLQKISYKTKILVFVPFVFVSILYLSVYFYNRKVNSSNMNYTGTVLSKDISKFTNLYSTQIIATLPLSYGLSRDGKLLGLNKFKLDVKLLSLSLLITATYYYIIYLILGHIKFDKRKIKFKSILVFSLSLILIPPLLTSLSVKYQTDMSRVGFGFGYFFVFLQYFGLAIFTVYLLQFIKKKTLISILFSIIFFLNFTNNIIVTNQANFELYNHEYLLKAYFEEQKIKNYWLTNDKVIFFDSNDETVPVTEFSIWVNAYPWKNQYLIYKYLNKRVKVVDLKNLEKEYDLNNERKIKIVIINSSKKPGGSYLVAGEINKVTTKENTINIDYVTEENIQTTISAKI